VQEDAERSAEHKAAGIARRRAGFQFDADIAAALDEKAGQTGHAQENDVAVQVPSRAEGGGRAQRLRHRRKTHRDVDAAVVPGHGNGAGQFHLRRYRKTADTIIGHCPVIPP
jgi:hypothetical protein